MKTEQSPLQPLIGESIWMVERPVKYHGVWLRSRSLVVRLEGGGLWVHSAPQPDEEMVEAIHRLGEPRWIVVPNKHHDLHASSFAAAFPSARVVGPVSVREGNAELAQALSFTEIDGSTWPEALQVFPIDGVPFLDETVFYHRPTRTLIGADLALGACSKEHWSWRLAARALGVYGTLGVSRDIRWKTKAVEETARSLRRILDHPIDHLSVAHADLVSERPADTLAEAWSYLLKRFP